MLNFTILISCYIFSELHIENLAVTDKEVTNEKAQSHNGGTDSKKKTTVGSPATEKADQLENRQDINGDASQDSNLGKAEEGQKIGKTKVVARQSESDKIKEQCAENLDSTQDVDVKREQVSPEAKRSEYSRTNSVTNRDSLSANEIKDSDDDIVIGMNGKSKNSTENSTVDTVVVENTPVPQYAENGLKQEGPLNQSSDGLQIRDVRANQSSEDIVNGKHCN